MLIHKDIAQCPHCNSEDFVEKGTTRLGYDAFLSKECKRRFNERTNTPFNHLEYPTDVVMMVVRWYLSYKLSLRDLPEMFIERGIIFSHETVRDWVERFSPLIIAELRKRRRGKAGKSWYTDETYVRIKGKDCYLYRAIDRDGNLVDAMLSQTRDMAAAKRFFRNAKKINDFGPDRVTTDGHPSFPRAIKETLGKKVMHRVNGYLHNFTEQSHRPIKARYYPMLGFGAFKSAKIICSGFEELRNFFRPKFNRKISLKEKRRIRVSKLFSYQKMIAAF